MGRTRHIVINYLTKHLLKALTEDDILQMTSEGYLLNKRKLSVEEVAQLQDEARDFKNTLLWKLMRREADYHAMRRMSIKATKPEDLVFGKAMLYVGHLQEQFLKSLSGE